MERVSLCWLAEEACLNGWPAPRNVMIDGWLLRAAGGSTRRANSVNPLRRGPQDPTPILAACEAIYASLGQPTLFRVPEIVPGMEAPLERLGYTAEGESCTLFAELPPEQPRRDSPTELTAAPSRDWLAVRARLNRLEEAVARMDETALGCLVGERAFAATRSRGTVVSIAFGVIHRGLLVLESVATDPAERRRGWGAATVGALLRWAAERGASGSCLQVEANNTPALALYRSLGFRTELYRYHYRRQPGARDRNEAAARGRLM